MNYKKQYNQQKGNAKYRSIEWDFTYESWIEWWGDDIIRRGTKSDSLCMCRKNDTGPYSPDNTFKDTMRANSVSAHFGKLKGTQPIELVERRASMTRGKPNPKISEALKGKILPIETKIKISDAMKMYHQKLKEAS